MKIESNKVAVNADREKVIAFLSDSQNIIHLLPEDKISDWKATISECSFKVQGGVIISLIQDGKDELEALYMKSGPGTPFPFRLTIQLKDIDEKTEGSILFDGEVNMFLRMMVEKPLTALFNLMSEKLKLYFEK